jgi:hypothetical protein
MNMNTRNRITTAIALAMLSISAFAADGIWTGASDATWAGANWTGGVPGTGDTATFNGAGNGNTTIDLGGGVTLLNLLFDTSSAAAYTIGSGAVGSQTLTLDNTASITVNATVTAAQTVNAAIKLGTAITGTTTIPNNSGSLLATSPAVPVAPQGTRR